jgi:hypothetical protein
MPPNAPLTPADYKAMAEVARARRQVTVTMFTGTKLRFGKKAAAKEAAGLATSGYSVYSSAKPLVTGVATATKVSAPAIRNAAEQFITTCAGVDNIREIVEVISSDATQNLIAEVTPVISVLYSGGKMMLAAKQVTEDGYHLYKSQEYRSGFRNSDPSAAADGVITIIKRDLAVHSLDLARNSVATGGKIAGLFVDFGTATSAGLGVANALAGLGLQLYQLGQEIADMRAGNARLARPDDIDLSIFAECPILGCYLITCADTSSVADFFIADMGTPGWMDRIEKMKKTKMEPMQKIATKSINDSRLQLEGLRSDKGTHAEKGFFARIKSKIVNKVSPSSTTPKVDKSRIVGMGSG